ncbi:hypothetical protein L1987_17773 [Smallanthus sonchifolius]|uniref:Uncharacterized protein n=1 Tax=Smallanthus sonchifolius TaxID=185202 RepID=A0ACB9IYF0_9ASTR|nr:hypothetical protein L1987_17773 [Smallanthus sonchifolius]
MNERWVAAAITNDALVAELLLRLKRSSSSDSLPPLNQPPHQPSGKDIIRGALARRCLGATVTTSLAIRQISSPVINPSRSFLYLERKEYSPEMG